MRSLDALRDVELPEPIRRIMRGGKTNGSGTAEDIHMGEPGFLHKLLRRRKLEGVFLFVTSRCNSRCRTCFYSEELNTGEDMTLDEMRRISESAPRFEKLWLSGGEPFMRDDLVDIIAMFYEQNGVKTINLPTNGLLGDRIEEGVERLLDSCPELTVHLNFSLDGLEETHDRIRGVEGSFRKTMDIMERLDATYRGHKRLHRNVATVVTPDGLDDLVDLAWHLIEKDCFTTQFFETVRGDPRDPTIKNISRRDLEGLHERLVPAYEAMADRLFGSFDPKVRWFAKLYFLGFIRFCYGIQEENVEGPSDWGMDCTAGKTTIVVEHSGALRACELRPRIGRIQDYDFDLAAALRSEAMEREIEAIGGGRKANCWCTHSCWIMSSMQFSPATLALRIPWAHLGPKATSFAEAGRDMVRARMGSRPAAG